MTKVNEKIEKAYEQNIRKKIKMKQAVAKVVQYLPTNKEIQNKEKEIISNMKG